MQTVIELRLSELKTAETIARVESIARSISNAGDPKINITIHDEYSSEFLDASFAQIDAGKGITFTMDEFTEYVKKLGE